MQYLQHVNEQTNIKINCLNEEHVRTNNESRLARLYREAAYTEKEMILYELCEYVDFNGFKINIIKTFISITPYPIPYHLYYSCPRN